MNKINKNQLHYLLLISSMLFIATVPSSTVQAVSTTAVPFLLISPSPRANGMGNTYTALSADDPMAVYFNPAYIGLIAREHSFSGSFYPEKMAWLPKLVNDMYYSYKSYNIGFNFSKLHPKIPISIGVGYSKTYLDMGKMVATNEYGQVTAISHAWDKSTNFSAGICVDYYLRTSFGLTFKHIGSYLGEFSAKANAVDIGFIFQLPLFEIGNKLINSSESISGITPFFVPVFSYSICNIGDKISYIVESQASPLSRVARVGIGFEGGFVWTKGNLKWRLFSLKMATEEEDILVTNNPDGTWNYRKGIGDIDIFSDLIAGHNNYNVIKHKGREINLFDVFTLRHGRYEDVEGAVCYKTKGFGLSFSGLLKVIGFFKPEMYKTKPLRFIVEHFDIQYHESSFEFIDSYHPLAGTKFKSLTIVI